MGHHLIQMAVEAFVGLGGIGLIIKLAKSNAAAGVNAAFDELDKFPKIKQIVIDHRADIEALFDSIDAAAKARMESDAKPNP